MQIDIQEFLTSAGITEPFYPGKKIVQKLPQAGEYKSHCVVYDWRDPSRIRIEVKAGLTGKDLPAAELKKYPPSLQAPTYLEVSVPVKGGRA